MQRTKILATQEVIGIAATTAIDVSTATLVRLHNNTTGIVTVGIATTTVGAATTSYFSMPAGSVEFIEKTASHVMWATAAINANKVGFTN
jgi:hypothetical protein